ncbi:MAG: fungal specific transcription factor domain-containing protein, partial [Terriglobus roseus]|nr:fungal specific transcription factor domain-containing protein [Terriglobus roseus]
MAMLDKRLKRMEDRVIKVIPKEELPDLSVTGRASVKPPIPGTTAAGPTLAAKQKEAANSNKKRSATEAFTQELASWTGPNRQPAVPPPSTTVSAQSAENKLFLEGADALPPQSLQEHLAEVFFTSLYGQSYLLLHKPSFLRKLRAGTVPPVLILAVCAISARFSTHPAVATEPAFLRGEQWATPARKICERRHYEPNITVLISMVLLGLHYFGTCEGGLSWGFGGMAMRMGYALQLHRELEREPGMRPSSSSAMAGGQGQGDGSQQRPQAGVGDSSNNTNSMQTTSNANTTATNINTTSSTTTANTSTTNTTKPGGASPPELSFTDREIRRRTMWACYLLDTFNSSGTERPSFLSEDYFSIQLPIKESHFQMEIPGPTEDLHGNVHLPAATRRQGRDTTAATNEAAALAAEAKANMGVAAYVVRSVVLWKRIVKYLNLGGKERDPHPIWDAMSEFASLARQITALKASLPDDLHYNADNLASHASTRLANQFLLLHIMLAQATLFLHRFAIPTYPSSRPHHTPLLASGMPKPFLTSSAQSVIDAAAAISALLADSAGHTLTVPFAGYCAYASATVHVWGIFSRLPSLETSSKENLRVNYRYLTRMKRYWGMFHYMAESVKETYRGFADASSKYASTTSAAMSRAQL